LLGLVVCFGVGRGGIFGFGSLTAAAPVEPVGISTCVAGEGRRNDRENYVVVGLGRRFAMVVFRCKATMESGFVERKLQILMSYGSLAIACCRGGRLVRDHNL
jgi:hypothetical protein